MSSRDKEACLVLLFRYCMRVLGRKNLEYFPRDWRHRQGESPMSASHLVGSEDGCQLGVSMRKGGMTTEREEEPT